MTASVYPIRAEHAIVPASLRAPVPVQLIDRARGFAEHAQADNTRRAYSSDLRDFGAFCATHGLETLPAAPQTIALYATDLAARSKKISTIRRRLAAIAVTHRRADLDSPCSHRIVREVIRGIARTNRIPPRRVDAVALEQLKAIILQLGAADIGAIRDRAILLLGFAAALRRSEIAALQVDDVHFIKQGLLLRIARSKTDQLGEGHEIAVPFVENQALCAVRAVRAWLDASGLTSGPLFRSLTPRRVLTDHPIEGQDVANLVRRLAERARLTGTFSGHSLRAGFATAAAQAKVSLDVIMRTTRHKSLAVLQGYIRRADAFDAPALTSIIN
jgi:site-specific recombinase XerD